MIPTSDQEITAQEIIAQLNEGLLGYNVILNKETDFFVDQSNIIRTISIDSGRVVKLSDIVSSSLLKERLGYLFEGGPSWIRVAPIPTNKDFYLISLSSGAKVGNPHPSIVRSAELNDPVNIIE